MNWHDIWERAGWTAIEVVLPTVPVGSLIFSAAAWKVTWTTALIAGVAFAVSVVKNLVKQHREGTL